MSNSKHTETVIKGGAALIIGVAGAAKAQELQGFYGGLSYSKGSGEAIDSDGPYSFDGNAAGAFVGYNHLFGDWLLGGEFALSNGPYESFEYDGSRYMDAENLSELKLRAGRVFGRTLVYGVVGRSTMDIDMFGISTDVDGDATATAVGLGFETSVGQRAFFGGEYLTRDLDLSSGPALYAIGGAQLDTLSLRMGLRF